MSLSDRWAENATTEDALQTGLTETEFKQVLELLGRPVSVLETAIFAALYSEHCSYKSTKLHLKNLPTEGPQVVQGPGENAGVVDIGDGQVIVFKIESHNHPSFIEPFQGAATGVGGILRDVFTMGARPVALMNLLRFGSPKNPRTKYLLRNAVAGIGTYGNCIGVPTLGGELQFNESFDGNCLVNAFALGIARKDQIFYGRAGGAGNPVIYLGSKTGRDGIHGATMASEEFDEDSEEKRPTVQVGDPFQEKLLLEACLEVMRKGLVLGIQDMGAAGLTSSSYEMADRGGVGLRLNLDLVPRREEAMTPYDLMLSESQERMLLVVERGREQEVFEIFKHWELDAVEIGQVIEGSEVELWWHGKVISKLPAALLTRSAPQYRWPEAPPADLEQRRDFPLDQVEFPVDLNAAWLSMLSNENLCARRAVYRQYDSTVRSNTVIHPGGDAALFRIKRSEFAGADNSGAHRRNGSASGLAEKGIAITLDCNSRFCWIDPRQGTALSLAEACRNIAAVGASPLALSNCLNFGSPERPEGMWQIAEAIRGLSESARAFQIPIISGNVSLYNETKGKAVWPTPALALVGLMPDASKAVGINFSRPDDVVFVFGDCNPGELGGSEFMAAVLGIARGALPNLDYDLEMQTCSFIRSLIDKGLVLSCHDVSAGGLAISLAECCFREWDSIGAWIAEGAEAWKNALKPKAPENLAAITAGKLFSESGARFIVSVDPQKADLVLSEAIKSGITVAYSGRVGGDFIAIDPLARIEAAYAYLLWRSGLDALINDTFEGAWEAAL